MKCSPIMIPTPDSTFEYGKNKDYNVRLIFKYTPSYIEWLIKNIDDFVTDIRKFTDLL